jgi:hypothetical protein
MRTIILRTLVLLVALAGLSVPQGAAAQADARCFPETGFCISGRIRTYWERNGGLAVFGYPIGPLQQETIEGRWTGPVQWFERDRLEDHANENLGVLAGRLGARSLELQGVNWQEGADNTAMPGCRFFRETGFNLCGSFLRYWERNGGLERFGYPLTRERVETVEGQAYTVQYFERRRMELHPENAGTPFEVLLGLLGQELYKIDRDCTPWFFSPAPLLCPQSAPTSTGGAVQRFERGVMIWTQDPDAFTIVHESGQYWIVRAPYQFATPARAPGAPPAGRYEPVSGFGDVWRGRIVVDGPSPLDAPLFTLLGWAVEPERAAAITTQCQRARSYYEQGCYVGAAEGPLVFYGPGSVRIVR